MSEPLTREQVKQHIDELSLWLTYPALDALHALDDADAALRAKLAAVERSLQTMRDVNEDDARYQGELEAKLEAVTKERDEAKSFHKQFFDRHAARESYMAEIAFQHIKHGDEQHQAWLRQALIDVLCKDDTKACKTFDQLSDQLAAVTKERDKYKELEAAVRHYVRISKSEKSQFIRENGRHGKISPWAELIDALDALRQAGQP